MGDSVQPGRRSQRSLPLGPLPAGLSTLLRQAACLSIPVLLEGETGTGKSYLAEWIHRLGPRAQGPFVPVNCAALPTSLIETELFGHERGAYTDARESRGGLVEEADGGTLFLDELAELPPAGQSKLLALMEGGTIRRVRGTRPIGVDVRIVCATNQDLPQLMTGGVFRQDLYYRCCGLRIQVPPLRERREQITAIARHLLQVIAAREHRNHGCHVPEISVETLDVLRVHSWPGNIRQLAYVLTVAILNSEGAPIAPEHLPRELLETLGPPRAEGHAMATGARRRAKPRYVRPVDPAEERRNIVTALQRVAGKRRHAARHLGMSRQVLWERIRFYGIEETEWTPQRAPQPHPPIRGLERVPTR